MEPPITYKRELLIKYVNLAIEKNSNKKDTNYLSNYLSDIDMVHFCIQELILNSNDLHELIYFYLFCAENEKIGMHEHIKDNNKISNHTLDYYDEKISIYYRSLKMVLFRKIDNVLSQSSSTVQQDFFKNVISDKKSYYERQLLGSTTRSANYNSEIFKNEKINDFMKDEKLSLEDATFKYFYDKNFMEKEVEKYTAGVDAIDYLVNNLGKNNEHNQSSGLNR